MAPVPPRTADRRFRRVLHGFTAAALALTAAMVAWSDDGSSYLGSVQGVLMALGLLALLSAGLDRPPWFTRLSSRLCLAILTMLTTAAALEVTLRLLHFDFRQQRAWIAKTPPGFRRPLVPTGNVFFRHEANVVWTGRPQATHLELLGFESSAYADERPLTLRYDEFGFRNEPRPDSWRIVVAGDSFTELGDVPYADLFTTRLGQILGCQVLNLGVADTGPLSQLHYLEAYGISPATEHAIVVFFEGNDLRDLLSERAAEIHFERTARRRTRSIQPQSSFLRAVGDWLTRSPNLTVEAAQPRIDAYFRATNARIPVTLDSPPLSSDTLTPAMQQALESFMARYAQWGRQRNVRVWLAYMPAKLRVLQARMEFVKSADPALTQWCPTDLPSCLSGLSLQHGIDFIDLTPDLIEHTMDTGQLVYNHLHDCHLNAHGSHVVARTLARALSTDPATPD